MKKQIIFIIASLLLSFSVYSQNTASISFSKKLHNFETIQEADGITTYQFQFENTGNKPLIINNVKASCGCTTPEWTKAPVAKGKSGFIKVSFDPKNRPGPFNKSITITSNASSSPDKLIIKGIVKERSKTIDDKYKYTMGGLKLKSNHIAMTKITNTETKTEKISIYNPTAKTISVEFDRIPSFIKFDKTRFSVKPKEKIIVNITYNAAKKKDWGFVTDKIYVIVDNKRDSKNRLTISAEIQEDFSKLSTEQLAKAPKLIINNKIFAFGDIKEGTNKSHQFNIKNEGKSDLIIHKMKSSCGCTVAKMNSKIIKAGENTKINVTFNSKRKSGKQLKTITLTTNDPKNSKIILRVKGNVLP